MNYTYDQIVKMYQVVDKPYYFHVHFPELESIRPRLLEAFRVLIINSEDRFIYYKTTVDYFVNGEFKDKITDELIEFLTFRMIRKNVDLRENPLVYLINMAFNPKSCKDLSKYIHEMVEVVNIVIYDYSCEVDFLDERFNNLYKVLTNLVDKDILIFEDDRDIVGTILAYCHMNDWDYNIVYDFFNNISYYKDKMLMNGIPFEACEQLYNFIPHLFSKEDKKAIK